MGKSAGVKGKFPRPREERSGVGPPGRRGPPRSSGSLGRWRFGGARQRGRAGRTRNRRGVAGQAPPARQRPTRVCDNLDTLKKGTLSKAFASQAARRLVRRFDCRSTLKPGKWLNFAKNKWRAMAREGLGGRRDGELGTVQEKSPSRLAEANGRQGGTGLADDGRRRSLPAQVGLPHNHLATRRWADPAQSTHQRTGLPIRALRGPNHRQVVPGPLVRSRESGHRSVARTHLAWLQWRRLKTCYYREEGRVAGWPPLKAAALPFDWGHSGNSRRRSFRLVRCREWRCQAKVGAGTRDRRGSTHGIELPPGKLSASRGSGGGLKPLTGQEEVAPNGACHAVRRATRERTRFGARS